MKQFVCNYAPVRFLPYREVGEFVNVGVILHCPQTDFFGYRLTPLKRTRRITGFFPELDVQIFKAGLKGMARELDRIQAQHRLLPNQNLVPPEVAERQMQRFQEIIRLREGLLYFGETGTLLAEAPEEALKNLFDRFVERHFAQRQEYQETVMRHKLGDFLRSWNLFKYYEKDQKVGDDDFQVIMPFVYRVEEKITKVIRPLDLDKPQPSDIYSHGGTWVNNMERLKKREQMPPEAIFTVRFPAAGKQRKAAEEICAELRALGVASVSFADHQAVRTAADIVKAA